jgi:Pyruvate/2-oxoacid:ferredoxin oxidoreductase gamma subunit
MDSKMRLILNSAQDSIQGNVLVGQRVIKIFKGENYDGVVVEFLPAKKKSDVNFYNIRYEDNDVPYT